MSKMFGNVVNRIMENDKSNQEIKIGTKVTEYLYSDRNVWEVIEVKSQKNVGKQSKNHFPTIFQTISLS